jgi:hypothetical protein
VPLRTSAGQALAFTLTRQSLTRWRAASTPEAVVSLLERVGPLAASPAWAPVAGLAARLDGFEPEHLLAAWGDDLTKRPAMRGEVHLLPRRRAPAAAAASPLRDELVAELDRRGLGSGDRYELGLAVGDVLRRHGRLPAGALHAALAEAAEPGVALPPAEVVTGLVLPWLWLRGSVERGGAGGDWRDDPLDVCPPPDAPLELPAREQADRDTARWYLEAFGPAADHDLAGWAGWRVGRARAALRDLAEEVVEVTVDGVGEGLVLLGSDAERLEATADGPVGSTALLPADDGLLHAYGRTRSRLGDEAAWRRVRLRHGHRAPAVLVDGRIVGTWDWARADATGTLDVDLWDPAPEARVRAEAQRLAGTVGAAGVELAVTAPPRRNQ